MFFKINVLKKFENFTGKHQCWSLLSQSSGPQISNFIKKRLQHRFFPVKFAKILRTQSPAAASAVWRFPTCNFVKNETPAKMFLVWILQNFKHIFWQTTSGWLLLVFFREFWEIFQNISFIENPISCTHSQKK